MTITPRKKQLMNFVNEYVRRHGFAPSIPEIAKRLKRAPSTIHQHLEELKAGGHIDRKRNQPRSVAVAQHEQMISVPLLGTIAAGEPIHVFGEEKESIAVAKSKLPKSGEIYALRVRGESMVDEGIDDGDTILVKKQQTADNGQKVVALIDSNEATLKTFYKERGQIRLQPANKKYQPITVKDKELEIQGVLFDIIKARPDEGITETETFDETLKKYSRLPINKIICGDALIELEKIPDNSINLIITDPPYGISRELNCKNQRLGTTAKLNFNFGEWDKFNSRWFDVAIKKTNGWIATFCAKKDIGHFWNGLEENDFKAIDVIVWQKPDPIPLNAKSRFLNAWEAMVIGKKAGATWNSGYQHNILKFQAPKGKSRIHSTQKPVGLIKELINLTTNKNDLVLDPFMGSGTTAVACLELERNYLGFEISKEYCEMANERIRKIQKPLL